MKTLSIRQPWAELILQGRKTIELRTWRTHYRGRFAIHAGGNLEREVCVAHGLDPDSLPRGALVGTVELTDMIDFDAESYAAGRDEHLAPGAWPGDVLGWRLANPARLAQPVPYRGRLGLFDVPDALLGAASAPQTPHANVPHEAVRPVHDQTRPFELRVEPREDPPGEPGYALTVYQWPVRAEGARSGPKRVVTLGGASLRAVADQVIETLRRADYRATDLSPRRAEPFRLDEENGLRLGLLFLAVKPLARFSRLDAIAAGLRSMPSEEAYYWYSKCTADATAANAQRALRILLAGE